MTPTLLLGKRPGFLERLAYADFIGSFPSCDEWKRPPAPESCSHSCALVSVEDVWSIVSASMLILTLVPSISRARSLLIASRFPHRCVTMIATFLLPVAMLLDAGLASAADGAISIATLGPYAEKAEVRDSIRQECGLSAKLSKRILERGIKKKTSIVRVGNPGANPDDPNSLQRHLALRITDAIETVGGLLPTHSLSIDGVLKEDGRVVGTFVGTRFARASLIPFRRGECAVLREAVNLLAKDVVKWVRKPSLDARLGDAR